MKYTTYLLLIGAASAQNISSAASSDYNTASGDMSSAVNDASGQSSSDNFNFTMTIDGGNA